MLIITAHWKAKQGKETQLKAILEAMVEKVRESEPDCLEYILHEGVSDKTEFFYYEQYKDQAAIDLHQHTPHFKKLIEQTKELIAGEVKVSFFDLVL